VSISANASAFCSVSGICDRLLQLLALKNMNPNSIKNLRPRQLDYPGERKRSRELSLTDSGWAGIKVAAEKIGAKSVSALVELIARGKVSLLPVEPVESPTID
jgi:hypothetical protein